jgi:hypothetical protein
MGGGIATAEEIRQHWRIPVIYFTVFSDDSAQQPSKITEPFEYIIKPFEDREIKFTIDMVLYTHQAKERLWESEYRLTTILTCIGAGVFSTDSFI